MKRAIVAPALLAGTALNELKQWLAITTTRDDAALIALLRAAIEACEGFTRQMSLQSTCEEMLPALRRWHRLSTNPVQAISSVHAIAPDGTRRMLDTGDYLFDITADGCGRVNLLVPVEEGRIAVGFVAGLAVDWESLPVGLRHGIIRLAAHSHRMRNEGDSDGTPPAAMVALWQPWRRLRLV